MTVETNDLSKEQAVSSKSAGIFQQFFNKLAQGGYPLFIAAVIAVLWANFATKSYHTFWHMNFSLTLGGFHMAKSLVHWVDEALMAIFFFTVGLEIKREFLVGGLSSPRKAALPIAAAVGGMIIPAFQYMLINLGMESIKGWAIPMATDIAFSLAILRLLGNRVPYGLKIFLTAFAIADDLGAVLVIALFYTPAIEFTYLYLSGFFVLCLAVTNLLWIRSTLIYVILGVALWFAILGSGIHATISGVIVALFIPARGRYNTKTFTRRIDSYLKAFDCDTDDCGHSILVNRAHMNAVQAIDEACRNVETPLQRLEHSLQGWIAFVVLPLFALANSGLVMKGIDISEALLHPVSLGIVAGLMIGKPFGIVLFTYLAARALNTSLGQGIQWRDIIGVGFLGGIGFTMSLFISGLSFIDPQYIEYAKLGIFSGSILCGIIGYVILAFKPEQAEAGD